MLVATGLLFLFLVMDLVLTEFNSLTLVTLAEHYASATIDAQRLAYMAAADYALATIPIATFYSWVVGSLGISYCQRGHVKWNIRQKNGLILE